MCASQKNNCQDCLAASQLIVRSGPVLGGRLEAAMAAARSCFFVLLAMVLIEQESAGSQEIGLPENLSSGRPFSSDRYLLSRQSYGTENSRGYEGQFRIIKRYAGGGYQMDTFDYIARCQAVDGQSMITSFRNGNHDEPLGKARVDPRRRPSTSLLNAYNLFWAACYGQFRKFR
jgi:hypothetical protein